MVALSQCTSSRGQSSLELILLVAFIFILLTAVGAYYFEIKDSTSAIVMAKAGLLEVAGDEPKHYVVERVDFAESADRSKIALALLVSPAKPAGFTVAKCASLANAVLGSTNYSEVKISVNGTQICNIIAS